MANRFQISRRPAHNLDEDDYENNQDNMPESEAVLAEREHGATIIRLLEQHNAELREHNAELREQIAHLQRQNDQLLAAQLRQPAGGQVNQQAGRRGVASGIWAVADALN